MTNHRIKTCPQCGAKNEVQAAVCSRCGNHLKAESGFLQKHLPALAAGALILGFLIGYISGSPSADQTWALSAEAARAYITVTERALSENRASYGDGDSLCRGILADLDNDGQQELALSHLSGNLEDGSLRYVLSMYDYEDALITLNDHLVYGSYGAAGANSAFSLVYQGKAPLVMTYNETGETSSPVGQLPSRYGKLTIYDGKNGAAQSIYQFDRTPEAFLFKRNGNTVLQKEMDLQLKKYDGITPTWEEPYQLLSYPTVSTSATQLLTNLYAAAGMDYTSDPQSAYEKSADPESGFEAIVQESKVDAESTPDMPISFYSEKEEPNQEMNQPSEKSNQPATEGSQPSSIEKASEYMKMISAGQYHSAVIYDDGTAVTAGRDTKGRCDTDGWNDIVQISAYSHTIGLRSNGTVVAAGEWIDGRCSVSSWNNIIDIDTGEKNTIGLCKNGTVLVIGDNDYHQREVSSWTNIIDVAMGSRTAYGLKNNGRVVAAGGNSSGQRDVDSWNDIAAISAGPYHVVGLRNDGTVVAAGNNSTNQCNVSGWTDIVAVSAGNQITIGVKSDGSIVYTGQFENYDFHSWKDEKIVAVSSGMYHVIALTQDGKVLTTGGNSYGQLKVGNCDLF